MLSKCLFCACVCVMQVMLYTVLQTAAKVLILMTDALYFHRPALAHNCDDWLFIVLICLSRNALILAHCLFLFKQLNVMSAEVLHIWDPTYVHVWNNIVRLFSWNKKNWIGETEIVVCKNVWSWIEGCSSHDFLLPTDANWSGEANICSMRCESTLLCYISRYCMYRCKFQLLK